MSPVLIFASNFQTHKVYRFRILFKNCTSHTENISIVEFVLNTPRTLVKKIDFNQLGVFRAFFFKSDYKTHFENLKKLLSENRS